MHEKLGCAVLMQDALSGVCMSSRFKTGEVGRLHHNRLMHFNAASDSSEGRIQKWLDEELVFSLTEAVFIER